VDPVRSRPKRRPDDLDLLAGKHLVEGLRELLIPIANQEPERLGANGVAERFVRTVRSECLDWLLILNQTQLERVLAEFMEHDNGHRPHRSVKLTPPDSPRPGLLRIDGEFSVQRRDHLGGVIHEYAKTAAWIHFRTLQAWNALSRVREDSRGRHPTGGISGLLV
jgi:hypothetical protein